VAPKHPQGRFEEGKEALGAMLVHLPTGVCLLRMIDVLVEGPLQRPRAAGRIGLQATPRLYSKIGRLLHGQHRAIRGRLDDHRPLPPAPGDARWAVFVVMAPPGLALLAASTWSCPRGFVPPCWAWPFCPAV
jgi:hypothetical protein